MARGIGTIELLADAELLFHIIPEDESRTEEILPETGCTLPDGCDIPLPSEQERVVRS